MFAVNEGFGVGVFADARSDVYIQHGVGEADVVLVALVGETVGRRLLHQLYR